MCRRPCTLNKENHHGSPDLHVRYVFEDASKRYKPQDVLVIASAPVLRIVHEQHSMMEVMVREACTGRPDDLAKWSEAAVQERFKSLMDQKRPRTRGGISGAFDQGARRQGQGGRTQRRQRRRRRRPIHAAVRERGRHPARLYRPRRPERLVQGHVAGKKRPSHHLRRALACKGISESAHATSSADMAPPHPDPIVRTYSEDAEDAVAGNANMTPADPSTPTQSTEDTSSGSSGSSGSASESDSEWDDTTTDDDDEDAGNWAPLQRLADEVRAYVDSAHARWMIVSMVVHGAMWMSSILLTMAVSQRASGMETRLLQQHGMCFASHAFRG